ncbi:MAG: 50S ribosomal protein L9 [Deltaproteobacteria bacterium]|nr:50S ribosomal protein L9 [bacterium]MCB9476339.1 50S ribosomal protein L9 [Deltaproteobacteria bacterium]MCB9478314.1 50S ribosomal protein L9 [Deltaproteobacteria bacterium]MCB9489298.1 50S ribosomal protein L9 [Deltaproteobacteria bacterium]
MKIIMLADVDGVGQLGDAVDVAAGYARNFLIPKKLAVKATERSIKQLEHQQRVAEASRRKQVASAESLKRKIETMHVEIAAKVGEEDKLYGSVTNKQIHEALLANGVDVDRKRIVLDEPIKRAGSHDVTIKLGYEVSAVAKVMVVSDGTGPKPKPKVAQVEEVTEPAPNAESDAEDDEL